MYQAQGSTHGYLRQMATGLPLAPRADAVDAAGPLWWYLGKEPAESFGGAISSKHLAQDWVDLREQLYDRPDPAEVTSVVVRVFGEEVVVPLDAEKGPRLGLAPNDYIDVSGFFTVDRHRSTKTWKTMAVSEQELCLIRVAKSLRAVYARLGRPLPKADNQVPAAAREAAAPAEAAQQPQLSSEEEEAQARERLVRRCEAQLKRPAIPWTPITIDTVTAGHNKRAKGMLYGLEFPWNESMLLDWGPEWLTRAFHAAGTLEESNRVVKIIPEKRVKVTTGNNGGKFLFEVRYLKPSPSLHMRLFAKVPFPLEGATRSDRLSSSVNKQPQELHEINTYRLLEAALPVKTPRFYFGDISNETSNWILITECVPFADKEALNFGRPTARRGPLRPFEIEGPYDKCIDHTLRGDPLEYYLLLVKVGAQIAGFYKADKLGSKDALSGNFGDMTNRPAASYGMHWAASGEDPRTFRAKLDMAVTFISNTGKQLFPSYAGEAGFLDRLRTTLLTSNAYKGEINYWRHSDHDYIALTHQNMNVDNAYFWRDAESRLCCGVFDWGGMGASSVGHKLWWWLYCMDFDLFQKRLDDFIDVFVRTYQANGGPKLDAPKLRVMVLLSAVEQLLGLVAAVPQIYKMCPQREWPTIADRFDPRIAENIDGKSTLRLYLHCMNSILRIVGEMSADEVLQKWVLDVYEGEFKQQRKADGVIEGTVARGPGL